MTNINFAKSILMILVVLGHSFAFWTGHWGFGKVAIDSPCLGYFSDWVGSFHVYAFVTISGFIYEYIIETRGGYNSIKVLAYKKARRLLCPYIFTSLLWTIPLTSFFVDIDLSNLVHKFLLGKSPAQLWFLLMLFNVFILFYPIRELVNSSFLFYALVPILYIIGYMFENSSFNFFQIFTGMKFLFFFTLGHFLYKYRTVFFNDKRISLSNLKFLIFLLALNLYAYFLYLSDVLGFKTLLLLFLNIEGSIAVMSILMLLGNRVDPYNKIYKTIKDNNFAIYLLHQQIIYFSLYFFNGYIFPYAHAILNFVISSFLSLLISIYLRRYKYVRLYVFGERN